MGKNQHVVPHGKDWAVKGAGNEKYTAITSTQAKATEIAKAIAKNQQSELIVHNQEGVIRNTNSYGNDPHPPIDKKP